MHEKKTPRTFRLSPTADTLLDRLAESLGLTRTGVLEMAIRQLARKEELDTTPPTRPTRRKKGKSTDPEQS